MENKPIHNDRFDALLYNALFPNMQTQSSSYVHCKRELDHISDYKRGS